MDWLQLIGLITQVAGPIVGKALADMDRGKVEDILRQARDRAGNIDLPALEQMVLSEQGPSAFEDIREDPEYRRRELEADDELANIAESGGLTLADKAALEAIRGKVTRQETAGRQAIEQGLRSRGHFDSGASLQMMLENQQDAADRMAAEGRQTAGDAQRRAYEAILERGRRAGDSQQRSFDRAAQVAAAKDAINRGNIAIRNTAQRYNAGLPQQNFENALQRENARRGADRDLAGYYGDQADATQDMWASGSQAVGQGFAGASDLYGSQRSESGSAGKYKKRGA